MCIRDRDSTEDADALYLKNQRQWVGRYLRENMGGNLEIYRNAAFFALEADDCYGTVHPREAQISESVLLICAEIQRRLEEGNIELQEDECIEMCIRDSVFGVQQIEHYKTNIPRDEDGINNSVYQEEPAMFLLKPHTRGYRERKDRTGFADQSLEKMAQRES